MNDPAEPTTNVVLFALVMAATPPAGTSGAADEPRKQFERVSEAVRQPHQRHHPGP